MDVHTHIYLPRYVSFLRARVVAPTIFSRTVPGKPGVEEDRLVILDNEPSGGRPVGPQVRKTTLFTLDVLLRLSDCSCGLKYWDRSEKVAFMDKHEIDVSVVRCFFHSLNCPHIPTIKAVFSGFLAPLSSANPWLDFLSAPEANNLAKKLNEDLEEFCSSSPNLDYPSSGGSPPIKRLYGLGLLPLVLNASPSDVLETIIQISSLPHLKGVIMGTQGLGRGLDDEELEPVWRAIERAGLVVFLHPHYGVPSSMWGGRDNGHVLPLALGFPFETTIVGVSLFFLS